MSLLLVIGVYRIVTEMAFNEILVQISRCTVFLINAGHL